MDRRHPLDPLIRIGAVVDPVLFRKIPVAAVRPLFPPLQKQFSAVPGIAFNSHPFPDFFFPFALADSYLLFSGFGIDLGDPAAVFIQCEHLLLRILPGAIRLEAPDRAHNMKMGIAFFAMDRKVRCHACRNEAFFYELFRKLDLL